MPEKRQARAGSVRDLLFELGTEELPPKALKRLSEALGNELYLGLNAAKLATDDATQRYELYAAPRRLAAWFPAVRVRQTDQEVERRGPALRAAYDAAGNPTPALQGFAKSCGVAIERLQTVKTDKGEWVVHRAKQKGAAAAALIPGIIDAALAKLPIPKRMRWGAGDALFVRPVHWVVLLFGEQVIPATILGVKTGRVSHGHRFMARKPVALKRASKDEYARQLRKAFVSAQFDVRKKEIEALVTDAARARKSRAQIEPALLDEVTALVEWPHAIAGGFDPGFLQVPQEVLIATMRDNQRYFAILDRDGRLLPRFVVISNIEAKSDAAIRAGNERVLRARFSDAQFFWDADRKQRLDSRVEGLKQVVFHHKLGSLYDKTERVARLVRALAASFDANPDEAARAATLAKADLRSAMVNEFPELQGVMGRYYARHDGESANVADAIAEHYLPRFAGDALPATAAGRALAVADRLDTLVGLFGAGEPPTGDKDPFALRRAALGALRILIEGGHDVDLPALIENTRAGYGDRVDAAAAAQVFEFMLERLRNYYLGEDESRHFRVDLVDAVLALKPASPLDVHRRLAALEAFRRLPEAASLAAANKRIRNILKQEARGARNGLDTALLHDDAEKRLAAELERLSAQVAPLFERREYAQALTHLAGLRPAVDAFFDRVLVMAEDARVRDNRLALLERLSGLFLRVADLSRLQS